MLTCIIVDDSPGFLAAAAKLLRRQGILVAGVASTGEEAVRLADELRTNVVLLDIALGPESGLELARRLHRSAAPFRTILISTRSEQDYHDLIAASPAAGFLPKTELSASAILELLGNSPTGPQET